MPINEWWSGDDAERYWVEITDRFDLGEDLWTPTRDSSGKSTWGYELINFIQPGDVVFHWHKEIAGVPALVGWSIATGVIEDTQIEWQAHGTYGRAAARPPARPAWRMGLEDYTPLDPVITYADVIGIEGEIRDIWSDLKQAHTGALYFPFSFSDRRPLRATQTYLAKFPRALAEFLQIADVSTELMPRVGGRQRRDATRASANQGYISDSRVRRAIERRAVELAMAWYEEHFETVTYTGDNEPYDLEVTNGEEIRRVEIKGTTGRGEAVELTHREVAHDQAFTPVDLFLVHGIQYERLADGNARGFGGTPCLWADWTPTPESLEPIRFRHRPPTSGFIRPDVESLLES